MPNPPHRANSLLHVNDRDGEHAPSYYAATAVGVPELPTLAGEHSCDVAVIGGGYSGLSCALHLAGRGYDGPAPEFGPRWDALFEPLHALARLRTSIRGA